MNLPLLWSVAALTSELCELATYLEDDQHFTKQDAANQLREIIERHIIPLHEKAVSK